MDTITQSKRKELSMLSAHMMSANENWHFGGLGIDTNPDTAITSAVGGVKSAVKTGADAVTKATTSTSWALDGVRGSGVKSGVGSALQLASSFMPRSGLDANAKGVDWQSYDFGADMTSEKADKWNKTLDATDIALDGVSAAGAYIPVYGWIVSAAAQAIKFGSKFLPSLFKDSDEELTEDYLGKRNIDAQQQQKTNYNDAFSSDANQGELDSEDYNIGADGGYFPSMEAGMNVGTIGGETHENGGTYIGMGANGKPDIAEKDEFAFGDFIFSNRF